MEKGLIKLNPELMALISHSGGGTDILPFRQEIFVINVFVAGTGYCEKIAEVQKYMQSGMQLTMRRHPDNKVDEWAIGIWYKDIRVGWVPMKDNLVIARLMDAGKLFNCKVISIEPDKRWPKINVSIYMID